METTEARKVALNAGSMSPVTGEETPGARRGVQEVFRKLAALATAKHTEAVARVDARATKVGETLILSESCNRKSNGYLDPGVVSVLSTKDITG